MSLTKFIRDVQSRFEAIPAPGAVIYNVTAARILRRPERKIVDDVVAKMNSGIMLDLGSGTGYLSIEIARRVPSLRVYGIDLSRQMVKIARGHAKGVENAQFELGNVANLPFDDDSIDFVVSTGALHHWHTPAKAFAECYRVLKNGKEAWIYDPCPEALQDGVDEAKKEYGFWGYRLFTKITELHGFTKEEYEGNIKVILDRSKFKDSYQMELIDIWMKTTLKKV